jgi:hypothetical protein
MAIDLSSQDSISKLIHLTYDTVFLDEAVIRPYKNYESFKRAFVNLEIDKQLENDMISKGQMIRKQIEMGANPDMDAFANYRNRFTYNLIRSNGVVLFSTEPGKGVPLIPLIKKMVDK